MADVSPPVSRSVAFQRHGLVSLAILLNAATIGTIVAVHQHKILMATASNGTEATIQKILPTLGAIIGAVITAVNALAISNIVTAYAKTVIVAEGMTFAQMSYMHTIGTIFCFHFVFMFIHIIDAGCACHSQCEGPLRPHTSLHFVRGDCFSGRPATFGDASGTTIFGIPLMSAHLGPSIELDAHQCSLGRRADSPYH